MRSQSVLASTRLRRGPSPRMTSDFYTGTQSFANTQERLREHIFVKVVTALTTIMRRIGSQWRLREGNRRIPGSGASYGALGHVPPRLSFNNFILVQFGVHLRANYPGIVQSARSADADVNNSQLFPSVLH